MAVFYVATFANGWTDSVVFDFLLMGNNSDNDERRHSNAKYVRRISECNISYLHYNFFVTFGYSISNYGKGSFLTFSFLASFLQYALLWHLSQNCDMINFAKLINCLEHVKAHGFRRPSCSWVTGRLISMVKATFSDLTLLWVTRRLNQLQLLVLAAKIEL